MHLEPRRPISSRADAAQGSFFAVTGRYATRPVSQDIGNQLPGKEGVQAWHHEQQGRTSSDHARDHHNELHRGILHLTRTPATRDEAARFRMAASPP